MARQSVPALAAIALLCAGCATGNAPDAAQRLPARLQRMAVAQGICDASVAVVRHRAVQAVETAHGCAAPSTSAAPADPVFQAASLSKPLFAYAVLKLVQDGKMDLDAPVISYLPNGYVHKHAPWAADSPVDLVTDPRLAAVTVRMALDHTSGLPNWAGGPLELDRQPGGAWRYSGEGYVLLQRAVEAVTGAPLDQYMRAAVFVPLGMTHSAYTSDPGLAPFVVAGADDYGNVLKPLAMPEPIAAFSLHTSAGDYARFLAALLRDQRMLARIVAAPVPVNAKLHLSWGLGWGLERRGGETFLWHWGNNPGYKAFVMASPASGDAFVLFTNSDKGMALARSIGEDVLPGPHPVYRFHLLRDGLTNLLCEVFGACG